MAMRFGMMAAAAACVVAAPAQAATVIVTSEADQTGTENFITGCCALNPTLIEFVIKDALPGAFVQIAGDFIGNIADDGSFTLGSPMAGITADNYGRIRGIARVYNRDGQRTVFTIDRFALEGTTAPGVPEPATWALMLLGFGAVGSAMRRKVRHTYQPA